MDYRRGLVQVGEHTWTFLQPDGSWGWSNAGVVVSGDDVTLIDTFFDLANTRELLSAIDEKIDRPIQTLVNTHHNGDHCWGNQLVDATIVGHEACRAEMIDGAPPALLASIAASTDDDPTTAYFRNAFAPFDFSGIELRPPTVTFTQTHTIGGSVPVDLAHHGPCHTLSDISCWVPADRVLFTGDLLFFGSTPLIWEGTFANWIDTIDELCALDPLVVVPGHGPVTDQDGLRAMQDYLRLVRDRGTTARAKGLTAMDAARDIDLGPYADWKDSERIALNMMRLYLELDGAPATQRIDPFAAFGAMAELASAAG